jgi:glyoxylase I family protein
MFSKIQLKFPIHVGMRRVDGTTENALKLLVDYVPPFVWQKPFEQSRADDQRSTQGYQQQALFQLGMRRHDDNLPASLPSRVRYSFPPTKVPWRHIMEKVVGIGGVFFRAQDPKALADWYSTHLGINKVPDNYNDPAWQQQAGPTVFAPFAQTTKYFGDPAKQWMLNFRVANLDALVTQLQSAGISVKVDPEKYPNGRFARTHDPEGNPIELWEPAGPNAK